MEVDHYAIDADVSRLTVRTFATGLLSALGHSPTLSVREFVGQARFTHGTLEQASVQIQAKAGSLTVLDKISEKDRREIEWKMNHDVLESEKYPEIVFASSRVSASKAGDGQYWINLVGDLSLHGINATQPVAAQVSVSGDTLRAHGEFTFRQTAYKIKPVSVGGGTLKLKDELKCSFDILARKQSSGSAESGSHAQTAEES
jgi:polyisoprenoid-binding protein YceI